ncbi:SAGA-associated factor 29-like [Cebus imitator]|uniref:SAGA-associated factor 29-like n=1 Tax=Cebus imitator TaxID=2715852 RepID=UPI001896B568|nr:SAGA-associated factor 29-like [Cebus imitator]
MASFLPTSAKILSLYNDSEPPRKTMCRGVLVTLLQQSAMTLPLWIGKPGPHPSVGPSPPLDYMARPGDKVAAPVKAVDGDEQWILAEVVSYSHATNRYEVDDIDEEGKESVSRPGQGTGPGGQPNSREGASPCGHVLTQAPLPPGDTP